MKKFLSVLLIALVVCFCFSTIEATTVVPKVYVNNVPLVFLNQDNSVISPTVIDGEVYVPLLSFVDSLGENISASQSGNDIYISTSGNNVVQEKEERIEITAENFYEYFSVEDDIDVDVSLKSSGFGRTFEAEGDINVTIKALYPCEISNLSFTVVGHYYQTYEYIIDERGTSEKVSVSLSCTMPQSGVCEASKDIKWTATVNPFCSASDTEIKENMTPLGFYVDEIKVKSGYIVLKNN